MHLSSALRKAYTQDTLSALEAQRLAQFIAWGPVVFQASRAMVRLGILSCLSDSKDGLTREEIVQQTGLSDYAVKCLLEASLSIGTILTDPASERYMLSKTGWFLLNDRSTRINLDFNHDVNYEGWFHLEQSLRNGNPEGLRHFGDWSTIYEGLSSLPPQVQQSWFAFDHFYSDSAFPEALRIVFDEHHVRSLYDVGGNTGKWALQCVNYSQSAEVTVLDLPQQIKLMQQTIRHQPGAERILGYAINLLDAQAAFPIRADGLDAIWMSQFLDCFSMDEIVAILLRARQAMHQHTRLFIMETLWDRQKYETAAFCLTMTSLYFTALANGNSKMYRFEELKHAVEIAGFELKEAHHNVGPNSYSLLRFRTK